MTARLPETEFLPWTKAFHAADAPSSIKNAHGYWGYEKGHGGHVICSVWDDKIMGRKAQAFIPSINKGGYREAASSLTTGDNLVQIGIGQDRHELQNLVERGARLSGFGVIEYKCHALNTYEMRKFFDSLQKRI
jgi:hypothetical protein